MSATDTSLRQVARAAKHTLCSVFSRWHSAALFFRWGGGWRAWTRGRIIPVCSPHLDRLEYFRHFVPEKGGLVMDVGGERGVESEQFAGLVGPRGRVVVCECMPSHVEQLRGLARRLPNLTVVECACWNAEGEIEFFTGQTPGSSTAVVDARGQRGQVLADTGRGAMRVRARRLDAVWAEAVGCRAVDFLKMDIEGAEYEALEGAGEMLKATRRAVIAAYHIRNGIPTAGRVAEVLRAAGFSVRIDENLHVYAHRCS